jgi:hypothetical protein
MELMVFSNWSISYAVFLPDIDDENKEIVAAASTLHKALADSGL